MVAAYYNNTFADCRPEAQWRSCCKDSVYGGLSAKIKRDIFSETKSPVVDVPPTCTYMYIPLSRKHSRYYLSHMFTDGTLFAVLLFSFIILQLTEAWWLGSLLWAKRISTIWVLSSNAAMCRAVYPPCNIRTHHTLLVQYIQYSTETTSHQAL